MSSTAPRLSGASAAALLGSATPALAAIAQGPSPEFFWWRWMGALALCLGLGIAGAFALRARLNVQPRRMALFGAVGRILRREWIDAPRRLKIIEAVRLNPQLEVCIIACDGLEYLVAATPGGVLQLSPSPKGVGKAVE